MNHFSLENISSNSKNKLFIVSLFSFFQQSYNFFICQYFKKISFFLHSIQFQLFHKNILKKGMENIIVSNHITNNKNDYYFKMFISQWKNKLKRNQIPQLFIPFDSSFNIFVFTIWWKMLNIILKTKMHFIKKV